MRQALHIFRKDLAHLWPAAAGWVFLWICFAILDASVTGTFNEETRARETAHGFLQFAIVVAGLLTITRLIQMEALPGDRQFWLARPYSRASLLAAKLGFIAAMLFVPAMTVQACLLAVMGMLTPGAFPGLLIQSAVNFLAYFGAGLGLATITRTLPQAALASFCWMVAAVVYSSVRQSGGSYWGDARWIQIGAALAVMLSALTAVLWLQYRWRRTGLSRTIATVTSLCVIVLMSYRFPPSTYALQERLSREHRSPNRVVPAMEPQRGRLAVSRTHDYPEVRFDIPVRFSGLAPEEDVQSSHIAVTLSANGVPYPPARNQYAFLHKQSDGYWLAFGRNREDFDRAADSGPLRLQADMLLILYGKPQHRRAAVNPSGFAIENVGWFRFVDTGYRNPIFLVGRTALASPERLLVRFHDRKRNVATLPGQLWGPTFTPWGAEPDLSPMSRWMYQLRRDVSGTVSDFREIGILPNDTRLEDLDAEAITYSRLAHIRRSLQVDGIRLADYKTLIKEPGL